MQLLKPFSFAAPSPQGSGQATAAGAGDWVVFTDIPHAPIHGLVHRLIDANYAPDDIYRFRGVRGLLAQRRRPFRVLVGHSTFGIDDFLPGQARYFTMLRDPVERALQHYFFLKRPETNPHRVHKPEQRAVHRATPLKEIFDKTASKRFRLSVSWLVDNMQTRYVAGYRHAWRSKASGALLAEAKRKLRDRYAVFGLYEAPERSLQAMADTFGWTIGAPGDPAKTYDGFDSSYDAEDLAAVKANNQLDLELWDFAQELFKERYG